MSKECFPGALSPEALRRNKLFRELVALICRGKAILLVGANVSTDAGMPSTNELFRIFQAEAKELGVDIPSDISLAEVAGAVERTAGREYLIEVLRREYERALNTDPPPYRKGAYRLISAIPELNRLLVTTNWDDLLRRALEDAGQSTVVEISELAQMSQAALAEQVIVKLHGTFDKAAEMLITDTDLAVAKSRITRRPEDTVWGYVASLLRKHSFIFLGYDLKDPGLRLLQRVMEIGMETQDESGPHFFVASLSPEEEEVISRWTNVRPILATVTNFLLALFRELREFVDRTDELDMVFEYRQPFVEFYGLFGSGRSALLDAVERQAQAKGWLPRQIVRVNWDRRRDSTPRDIIKSRSGIIQVLNDDLEPSVLLKRFEDFGDYLLDKKGPFLIFDATERVKNQRDLVSVLSEVVAPAIQEMNERRQRSKLLLAGRYPLQGWPYSFRRGLLSHALTPFDASVVRELAQKFLLATDPDSQERFEPELITDILEVSSGHAGFIKAILIDVISESRRRGGRIKLLPPLTEKDKRTYVSRFNADIDEHVPWESEPQREVYEETLCVFRWLNREIVRGLNLPFDPLPSLAATYVLSPDDFSNDPVIRRTKMLRLRYEQPEKFIKGHQRAQKIFASGIERLVHPTQLDYIIEWLFHTMHLLIATEPENVRARCEKLAAQIAPLRYQAYPERVRGAEIGSQVVGQITEDPELWKLLEKCVGKDEIERILAILEEKEAFDVRQS